MKKYVLWDLDGTLTNPKTGIIRCIQHALKTGGHAVPEEKDLLWCIGPPLHLTFQQLVPGTIESDAWKLVAHYRERFTETGLYENEVFEGIPALLKNVEGKTNFVATSKPHPFAKRIITHFGLDEHFKTVYGSEFNGERSDKAELIQHVLESEKINPTEAYMIGDRKYDILGAKKSGVTSIGITWGFGEKKELEDAKADHIFDSPAELENFLKQN